MPASTKGFEYEKQIIENLKKLGICGNVHGPAGANAHGADAEMLLENRKHNLEIKLNAKAQMGGTSVRYQNKGSVPPGAECVEMCHSPASDAIENAVLMQFSELDKLLDFVQQHYDKNITGFPFSCPKSIWEKATEKNLLVNTKESFSTSFIEDHYHKKEVNFIQIGGRGLFFLRKNPTRLPVAQLSQACPTVNIEIRTARSGSKKNKSGVKMVGVGIRAQARLPYCGPSNVDLDKPASVLTAVKVSKEWRTRILHEVLFSPRASEY